MKTANTLAFRLFFTSSIWVIITLVITGLLLIVLFRSHVEERFEDFLFDQLQGNIAASDINSQTDTLHMTWSPSNLRFHRPLSGWYWQILHHETSVAHSPSLWDATLSVQDPGIGTGLQRQTLIGPDGQELRALVEKVTLPDSTAYFTFIVAGPLSNIDQDVQQFAQILSVTLVTLGLGLLGAVFLQIRVGLRPLRQLKIALAQTRSGQTAHLPETFPMEIQPVVSELNALLDHNTALLDRARTQTANLAHALKNPLTVLTNEVKEIHNERGQILNDQIQNMTHSINRYLAKARTAGAGSRLRTRVHLAPVAEDLRFSIDHLYKEKNLQLHISGLEECYFHGDTHDVEEMLGNLLDNACKWAHSHVSVHGELKPGRWRLTVQDDGPGISHEQLTVALQRGRRLDETTPGHGLGLNIVTDIITLYGGSLQLQPSLQGGVSAILEWPATQA